MRLVTLLAGAVACVVIHTSVRCDELPIVPDDVSVSLFAAEPLVRNPSALVFDARGRLLVGQGPQYRGPTPETEGDRVDYLFDDDGDGRADRAHTFAAGLNSIQGLAWCGDALYIANAPDLTVVRDLNGDDVADEYTRLFTGLGSLEHGLHGLHVAPDGRLYMSKGNTKGRNTLDQLAPKAFRDLWGLLSPEGAPDFPTPKVFTAATYQKNYKEPQDDWGREGGILRCNPDGTHLEIVARGMRNPWDIAFDDSFEWLGTDNDQTQGDKFIAPFFGAHYGWGHPWSFDWEGSQHLPSVPANGPLFEGSGAGVVWFDEPTLPERFRRTFLIADWMQRRIYAYRPTWQGCQRAPDGVRSMDDFDILADAGSGRAMSMSSGILFDPTDMAVGPDGSLFVASWGREYALTLDDEGQQANAGRVFRLISNGNPATPAAIEVEQEPVTERSFETLLTDLGSPLEARQVAAQNEMLRRGDIGTLLRELDQPQRLTARQQTWLAWTAARSPNEPETVNRFFASRLGRSHPLDVRLEAIRLLGFRNALPEHTAVLLADPEPRVRFTAAVAVREARDRRFSAALIEAVANETDRLTFYAQWNALRENLDQPARYRLLDDDRGDVRLAALLGLLEDDLLQSPEVRDLIDDGDPRVVALAADWLEKSGNGDIPLLTMTPASGEPIESDRVAVTLSTSIDAADIRYTLNGDPPVENSAKYTGPVSVEPGQRLRAAVFRQRLQVGRVFEGTWGRPRGVINPSRPVSMLQPPESPVTVGQVLAALPEADISLGRNLFFDEGGAGCSQCHRLEGRGQVFAPDLSAIGSRASARTLIESILEPSKVITEGFTTQAFVRHDGTTVSGIVLEESGRQIKLGMTDGVATTLRTTNIESRHSLATSAMPAGYATAMNAAQLASLVAWLQQQKPELAWTEQDDALSLSLDGRNVATYLLRHGALTRRAFVNVQTPSGIPVTRTFPPEKPADLDPGYRGEDGIIHPVMHPGIWMSFGWINGHDYWRLKAPVVFERFLTPPTSSGDRASFATRDRYLDETGEATVCTQDTRIDIHPVPDGLQVEWDATFFSDDHDVVFGDQEESGLAIRVASPLRVLGGVGTITNDRGERNGEGTWGREFTWIDYSGNVGDQRAGLLIVPHPDNPRRSWSHSRDYGVLVANPFPKQPKERREPYVTTTIKQGDRLRLRYTLLIHEGPADTFDPARLAATIR